MAARLVDWFVDATPEDESLVLCDRGYMSSVLESLAPLVSVCVGHPLDDIRTTCARFVTSSLRHTWDGRTMTYAGWAHTLVVDSIGEDLLSPARTEKLRGRPPEDVEARESSVTTCTSSALCFVGDCQSRWSDRRTCHYAVVAGSVGMAWWYWYCALHESHTWRRS